MTPIGRAFLGAALGAIATLAVHPTSRVYLLAALVRQPPSVLESCFDRNVRTMTPPRNLTDAGRWVEVAAERMQTRDALSPAEMRTLVQITQEAGRREPENAFWPQFRAVLLNRQGDRQAARLAWQRAARCQAWNDTQTERLLATRERLAQWIGSDQAWQYALVFYNRTDAAAVAIERYAQAILLSLPSDPEAEIAERYVTIRNGALLRDGSRALKVGVHGANIVEFATFPPSLMNRLSPKRIWIAKTRVTAMLRAQGRIEDARRADKAFEDNDSWEALTERENPEESVRSLALTSILLSSLPGACMVFTLASALLLVAVKALQPVMRVQKFFLPAQAFTAAAVFGGFAVAATRSWTVGAAVAACLACLAMGPRSPRRRTVDDLGPLFSFVVGLIWVIAAATIGLYLSGTTTTAQALLPRLGSIGEYFLDVRSFLAVGMVVMALLALAAPAWAVVRRFGTPDVLTLLMRRFAVTATVGGILAGIVLGPLTVYLDGRCRETLSRIVKNEPVYYLFQ